MNDVALPNLTDSHRYDAIGRLGAKPFQSKIVQTPWSAVVDSSLLHQSTREELSRMLNECGQKDTIRCATIVGITGYGKTHLLAWLRAQIDADQQSVFIYVPAFTPASRDKEYFEQHVARSVYEALFAESVRHKETFANAVRTILVRCYDRVIESRGDIEKILGRGGFFTRLIRPDSLRIRRLNSSEQDEYLRLALERKMFIELAFQEFSIEHADRPDGINNDPDAFVAACLLTCGTPRQRWHAERWFHGKPVPPDIFAPFHLHNPLRGTDKFHDVLFTLRNLSCKNFCLALDQIEDTYDQLTKLHTPEETADIMNEEFSQVRKLWEVPGFCVIFSFEQAIWERFTDFARTSLMDRMIERGVMLLKPLDEKAALDIVAVRMKDFVWNELDGIKPPTNQPLFPFDENSVVEHWRKSGRILRDFLRLMQERYEVLIDIGDTKPIRKLELTSVTPNQALSHESIPILIKGKNIPHDVKVYFHHTPAKSVVVRPAQGEIDVATPTELVGNVALRIVDAEQPKENNASLSFTFKTTNDPKPKKPFHKSIDGSLLRAARERMNLTQKALGELLGESGGNIGKIEREEWKYAPDDLYIRLAEFFERPLSDFAKEKR